MLFVAMRQEEPLLMLPALYHLHHSMIAGDLPFWLDLAGEENDPLLELGCGTGRVLLELARAGHTAYGLERDEEMLAYLQFQAKQTRIQLAGVFLADMTAFHLAQIFGLIILPCNTWSTLTSDERRKALVCIRRALRWEAVFAVSLPNPYLLKRLPRRSEAEVEEVFYHPFTGDPVQVSSSWQRTPSHFELTWYYDILHPDGRVERLASQVNHHLDPVETYLDELEAFGFNGHIIFGDYERAPFTFESPQLIILASNKF
jgi:SAM-dependent methyltransferase